MHPLRLSLFALLLLAVLGLSQEAEADMEIGQDWSYNFTENCSGEACIRGFESISTSGDGQMIAVGGKHHITLFSKTKTNGPLWSLNNSDYKHSRATALSQSGDFLAVGSLDYFHFFNTNSSTPLFSHSVDDVNSVAISEDGNHSVAGSFGSNAVYAFDREGLIWSINGDCGSGSINEVDISANGDKVVYVCKDNQNYGSEFCIYIISIEEGSCKGFSGTGLSVAISDDGEYAVAGGQDDGRIALYSFDEDVIIEVWNEEPYCEGGDGGRIWNVDISANGDYILGAGPGGLFLYNNAGSELWCNGMNGFPNGVLSKNLDEIHGIAWDTYHGFNWNGTETSNFSSEFDVDGDLNIAVSENSRIIVDAGLKNGNDYGVLYVFGAKTFVDIESINPNPANHSDEVFFTGSVDQDIIAIDFYWNSSIDGVLSRNQNFTIDSLSVGTHSITFTAKSSEGEWSVPSYEILTVNLPLEIVCESYLEEVIQHSYEISGNNVNDYDYVWDFSYEESDGFHNEGEGDELFNTYSNNGTFLIKVEVSQNNEIVDYITRQVFVYNRLPEISFDVPESVLEGEYFNITVSGSDYADNFTLTLWVPVFQRGESITCTTGNCSITFTGVVYEETEVAEVSVTAIELDDYGDYEHSYDYFIVENIPPILTNLSIPNDLFEGELGYFSGEALNSDWEEYFMVRWSIDGWSYDQYDPTQPIPHMFYEAGTYEIEACAWDFDGDSDCEEISFLVSPIGRLDELSSSPQNQAEQRTNVDFIASCYHCENSSFSWVSSIDGFLNSSLNFTAYNLSLGYHEMKLNATHEDDRWDVSSKINFWVYAKPLAFAGQNATGTPGVPLQFSGAGTDEDGTIAKYEWDFDGDGIFEWSSTENGRELNIYNNEGTYTATLRVTDNDGFTDTDTVEITISEKKIQIDDEGNVTVTEADEDDEGIPGFGFAAAILLVGLIARAKRD